MAFVSWCATVFLLAPLLCMGQEFNPSAYGLPGLLEPSDVFTDLCESFNPESGGDPLPTQLPQQFSVHVEANIVNKNMTFLVDEFYDNVNNRGSLAFISDGVRQHAIYDYADNEIFVFPDADNGRECGAYPLDEAENFELAFGLTRMNGSLHIGTTSAFLGLLRDDIPTQALGMDSVRGTPAMHWKACINFPNISFFADYYYTSTDIWSYATVSNPEEFDLTLTQIVVQGNSLHNDTLEYFYHVYSAFAFQSGPESVPDSAFTVPSGLACVGRNVGIPVPQVPDYFSTYVQYASTGTNSLEARVATFREYYDFSHQLFRLDAYYDGRRGGSAGPVSIVHDFDSQLQYVINRHVSSCNVTALSESFGRDVIFDGDGNIELVSPRSFFLIGRDLNYSYEGVSTVRGLKVDSWIAIVDYVPLGQFRNLTNGVIEVFFTRPEYNITTDRSAGGNRVPWRSNVRGLLSYSVFNTSASMNVSYVADYFDFSASEPPYDSFDVSICSDADQSHTLDFRFKVPREGIDFSTFRTNFRASLVSATQLRPLQVNNIHIISSNETHIFVVLHFTNLSDLAQISDTDTVVTADEALETLRSLANDSMPLPFQVDVSNGVMVSPILFSSNRGRIISCNATCDECPMNSPATTVSTTASPEDNITSRLGLSDGVVAGIAVGLFFGGFLLGLLFVCACYTCMKCSSGGAAREVSSVKYKKHSDELESIS